jgi:hypothetical protein
MQVALTMLLLAMPALVGAQASDASSDSMPAFWKETREEALALGLPDLTLAESAKAGRELRLWSGFGVTGTRLTRLHEVSGEWRGDQYYPVQSTQAPRQARLPVDSAGALWRAATAAGLKELPRQPMRPPSSIVIDDGYAVVIEWFDGTRYGVSGSLQPDYFCTPDDRRILAVVRAVLGYAPLCK